MSGVSSTPAQSAAKHSEPGSPRTTVHADRTSRKEPDMLAREKWQAKTIEILDLVFEERLRQVARYGHNQDLEDGFGPRENWLVPVIEEDALDATAIQECFRMGYELHEDSTGSPTWMHLIREEVAEWLESEPDSPEAIAEALQVAALFVSWVEKKL